MNWKVIDETFKETVKLIKSFGFDVYCPEGLLNENEFRYGYVTDGKHILYFEVAYLFAEVKWSTRHIPKEDMGSGVSIDLNPITKENIIKAFNINYSTPYKDFEQFKKKEEKWRKLIKL